MGLNSLLNPLFSNINDSKNRIEMIGATSLLPGWINQIDPNNPRITGIKK